jgi:hypothetical protein
MAIFDRALEHVFKEWGVIKQAPLAFFASIVVGALLGVGVASWHYSEHISTLEGRIADYKERLGLIPPDKSAYSKLTNQELKHEVADFVPKLREFHHESQMSEPNFWDEETKELRNAQTEEQRKEIMQRYFDADKRVTEQWYRQREERFNKEFQAKAMVLHDELRRRIPADKAGPAHNMDYEALAGPSPINDIATDLERLSNLLPESTSPITP